MKTRRYSEAQVFRILKEVESGMSVVNTAREHGVSPATTHRWKSKYGGMILSELKRLKEWLYRKRTDIRLERDRAERRQKKEEEVARRKVEQPALFDF